MTDRTVLTRLKLDVRDFVRGTREAGLAVKALTSEIDTSSDRTAYLAQGFLALGPTIAPLGAAAIPVFSGLATQLTVAGAAAATAGLAFNGVGDALKALNDYQIDPTDAHLKKLNQTMNKIGPAGQEFVHFLDEIGPQLSGLANTAREGLFPGLEAGITHLLDLLPKVKQIVGETSKTLGDLANAGGAGLAGPRFAEFFEFLRTDAQPILVEMGHTIGNFVDGIAALIVAFGPLSQDFSKGFEDMSKSFADWAHGLDSSQSFADFVAYIRDSGPKVRDLLSAIADAVVGLLKAAAPVGNIMLPAFTSLFKIIDSIASSDLGPFFVGAGAAIGLYGRAVAIADVTTGGFVAKVLSSKNGIKAQGAAAVAGARQLTIYESSMARVNNVMKGNTLIPSTGIAKFAKAAGPAAATAGLLAVNMTGVADKAGLTNTAALALVGTFAGPWGAAIGAGAGAVLDLSKALGPAEGDVRRFQEVLLAKAGPSLADQLKAVNDEIEVQKKRSNATGPDFHVLGTHVAPFEFGNEWRDADAKLRGLKDTAKELESQIELNKISNGRLTESQQTNTEASRKQAEAFNALRGAAQTTGSSFVGLGADFDNAKVSLTGWIEELEDQADALTNFGKNTAEAARRNVSRSLIADIQDQAKTNPEAAARRMRQLADATETQIRRANEAYWSGQRAIKRYTETITGIPETWVTRFHLDGTDTATEDLRRVIKLMASIKDKSVRLDFFVNQMNASNKPKAPSLDRGADGATVPKTGMPYADRHLYLVADGEEIVSNRYGQADRHRDLLKAISANRYANGGTAGFAPSTAYSANSGGSGFDLEQISELVHATRPLIGTQVVQPHDYSEFERQQNQNKRMASAGGAGMGSGRGGRR